MVLPTVRPPGCLGMTVCLLLMPTQTLTESDTVWNLCVCAGAERLKEALSALGLKCGGAPMDRAKRLFLTKHTPLSQIDKKQFAPGVVPPSVVSARSEGELEALSSAALHVSQRIFRFSQRRRNIKNSN